ncbi:MAG: hypothetical protein OHK0041_03860 [Anaerolineales bacterium]
MKDTIRTLHPDKKQGVNISREKYEIIHRAITSTLSQNKEMPFMKLARAVEKDLHGKFEGSVTWYVTTVKLDMEARGELKRVRHSRPQVVRLVK